MFFVLKKENLYFLFNDKNSSPTITLQFGATQASKWETAGVIVASLSGYPNNHTCNFLTKLQAKRTPPHDCGVILETRQEEHARFQKHALDALHM